MIIYFFFLFSKKDTQSVFFGADVGTNETQLLAAALTTFSTTVSNVQKSFATIEKAAEKFTKTEFTDLAKALSATYNLFNKISNFIKSFQENLKGDVYPLASTSAHSVDVFTSQAEEQLDFTTISILSDRTAPLFSGVADSIKTAFNNFVKHKSNMIRLLGTIKTSFEATATASKVITAANFNIVLIADLNGTVNLFNLESNELKVQIDKFALAVTATDQVNSNVTSLLVASFSQIQSSINKFDPLLVAAKNNLSDAVVKYQSTLSGNFASFFLNSSSKFASEVDYQSSRKEINKYVSTMKASFQSASTDFSSKIDEFSRKLVFNTISTFRTGVSESMEGLKNSTSEFKKISGSGADEKVTPEKISSCLGATSQLAERANNLIKSVGTSGAACMTGKEVTVTNIVESIKFLIEDILFISNGISDKLCSCSVSSDVKDLEDAIACIKKVKK